MTKVALLKLFLVNVLLVLSSCCFAQVGIGTNSPSGSAQLEVRSTNKGFLPPRLTLTGTSDVSTIASPATGLLVYNTTATGSGATAVTPGFYYYDGARWQRIINQQPDATISFNQNTPTTAGVVFTPNIQNSTDYIYVSSTNNSQWTYNGSMYVTYTPPASTPWMLSGGTTDAGSNKSDAIYRTGSVGIGSTTTPNTSAQLDVNSTNKGFLPPRMTQSQRNNIATPATGLLIYQTDNTPGFYYYNGSAWAQGIGPTGATGPSGPSGLAVPAWTSAGLISFGATTTAPTLGTTTENNMSYRQLGQKEWEVVMALKTTGSGASVGNGDYLFTLPNGLSFDLTLPWQTAYALNIGSASVDFQRYAIPSSSGYMAGGSLLSINLFIVPYSSTKYRVIIYYSGAIQAWGSSYFALNTNMGANWTFKFTSQ